MRISKQYNLMKILIINGPNLNMLGKREEGHYGAQTFDQILEELQAKFPKVQIEYFQSNHEGAIIDRIHQSISQDIQAIIINAGAFTHYSYAIYDALLIPQVPKIEVHISHIFAREEFRQKSVISPACQGLISGFGKQSYALAIQSLLY